MTKQDFGTQQANGYADLVIKMISPPPSEAIMDKKLIQMINRHFGTRELLSPAQVWNRYKELLDLTVRHSLGSGFVVKVLDIEPYFNPPEPDENTTVVFSHEKGNMGQASWRVEQ